MELECAVQNYAWGKIGKESMVAKLGLAGDPDPEKCYAELWMGTHPSGPSKLIKHNILLKDWLEEHPESLGSAVLDKFGNDLPFLFKVLSVNKALSIQAHPNKSHAEELHASRPDIYKDPNHKPEMAIALTEFHALCGFRPLQEIKRFLTKVSSLVEVVGEEAAKDVIDATESNYHDALKKCFTNLMTCPQETLLKSLNNWVHKVRNMGKDEDVCADLFLTLHDNFPGDVGCFGVYFFNHVVLQPGDAMFLGPNEPHAYLKGDCIECMACSDNVVRAGLTPKLKDVDTLCDMLTYKCATPQQQLFKGKQTDNSNVTMFSPPVPDFCVYRITVPAGCESVEVPRLSSASIILAVRGSDAGKVEFIPANSSQHTVAGDPSQEKLLFLATANI